MITASTNSIENGRNKLMTCEFGTLGNPTRKYLRTLPQKKSWEIGNLRCLATTTCNKNPSALTRIAVFSSLSLDHQLFTVS